MEMSVTVFRWSPSASGPAAAHSVRPAPWQPSLKFRRYTNALRRAVKEGTSTPDTLTLI